MCYSQIKERLISQIILMQKKFIRHAFSLINKKQQ